MIARYDGEKLNDYVIEGLSESGDSTLFFDKMSYLLLRVGWMVAHRLMQKTDILCIAKEKKIDSREDCSFNRENHLSRQ